MGFPLWVSIGSEHGDGDVTWFLKEEDVSVVLLKDCMCSVVAVVYID